MVIVCSLLNDSLLPPKVGLNFSLEDTSKLDFSATPKCPKTICVETTLIFLSKQVHKVSETTLQKIAVKDMQSIVRKPLASTKNKSQFRKL